MTKAFENSRSHPPAVGWRLLMGKRKAEGRSVVAVCSQGPVVAFAGTEQAMVVVSYGSIVPMTVVNTSSEEEQRHRSKRSLWASLAPTSTRGDNEAMYNNVESTVPAASGSVSSEHRQEAQREILPTRPLESSSAARDSEYLMPDGDGAPLNEESIPSPSMAVTVAGAVANLCSATLGAGTIQLHCVSIPTHFKLSIIDTWL
jgi:hypothetical protein